MRALFMPGERPVLARIAALSAIVTTAVMAAKAIGGMSGWVTAGPHNILGLLLNFLHIFSFGDSWTAEIMAALLAASSFLVAHFAFSWLLIGRAVYLQGVVINIRVNP